MMSSCALSELHVVPLKTTVIESTALRTFCQKKDPMPSPGRPQTGRFWKEKWWKVRIEPSSCRMTHRAPAPAAQQWGPEKFRGFLEKSIWPGNSPDLNPIENIWSIMQQKLDEENPSVDITGLVWHLRRAWANISPSVPATWLRVCRTECAAVSLASEATWVAKI